MRIGIDLGGTKIEIIALDERGATLLRRRVATPSGDYAGTVNAIVDLVGTVEAELGRRGTIGVATPGAVSLKTGLMKNCNSTALNGQPLQRDLADRLGRAVRLANDANCFALSEAVDGAGADAEVVFGVILGTGVGGGIAIDRRALACLDLYRDRLARALATVIDVVDPDVVVLGGGLSNIAALYIGLPALIGRYAFSDAIDTPVVPAAHGDSSGVRGAAWLWPDDDEVSGCPRP